MVRLANYIVKAGRVWINNGLFVCCSPNIKTLYVINRQALIWSRPGLLELIFAATAAFTSSIDIGSFKHEISLSESQEGNETGEVVPAFKSLLK